MPRPLKNNPSNLPVTPNHVRDPDREQELIAEFIKRCRFAGRNYRAVRAAMGTPNDFNRSLRALKAMIEGRRVRDMPDRLHPEIELVVGYHAKRHAAARRSNNGPNEDDMAAGVRDALRMVKPNSHRPTDAVLHMHVAAIMAAVQEATGKPALVARMKNSVYDPQATSPGGEAVIRLVRYIDPDLPLTTIVNTMEKVRKQYAGKPLRFVEIFPIYGSDGMMDAEGKIHGPHAIVEVQGFVPPTYFRYRRPV